MEKNLTGIVLQARIDSTRLPGKALLPLGGKPLILRVMEALNHVNAQIKILACSEDSFSSFKPLSEEAGFHIFGGPKEDVLERFCRVIRNFSLSRVIRATGDNPFVFTDAASSINCEAITLNTDYAAYDELPYGAGIETVAASALLQAAGETASPYDREHVCPYLYNNPQIFNLHRPPAPPEWHGRDIRLTVDTQEDYEHAEKLYTALKGEKNRYNGAVIIRKYNEINAK